MRNETVKEAPKTEYEFYKVQAEEMYKRSKEYLPNCLSYALRFWDKNREYKIWYNSGHCINIPIGISALFYTQQEPQPVFLPVEDYGYDYFSGAFEGLLSEDDKILLNQYFNK